MLENKHSNICIIEVPEGEEKEQEIGNLGEKIMKENFPNLAKELEYTSRKHRVPNNMNAKRPTPRHIIIKMPKVKNNEKTLKAVRYLQGSSHKTVS